ncbi:unnamed protein product, partial [Medioppia subpectinata]
METVYTTAPVDDNKRGVFDAIVNTVYDHCSLCLILVMVLIPLAMMAVSEPCLGAGMSMDWFIFHKLLGYLWDNHVDVVRSDVPCIHILS